MTTAEIKLGHAISKIRDLFNDQSVSRATVKESLQKLALEIALLIAAIDEDEDEDEDEEDED